MLSTVETHPVLSVKMPALRHRSGGTILSRHSTSSEALPNIPGLFTDRVKPRESGRVGSGLFG